MGNYAWSDKELDNYYENLRESGYDVEVEEDVWESVDLDDATIFEQDVEEIGQQEAC